MKKNNLLWIVIALVMISVLGCTKTVDRPTTSDLSGTNISSAILSEAASAIEKI